ncbi:MAG: hypothetical protein VB089_04665 [Anaerolineaceae bacterium]|nr:hypothetical protein [Anaerolineaceae bacterium]
MTKTETSASIPGILILSHGPLCTAIIKSAEMINGDVEGVAALPFEEGQNVDDYARQAKEIFENMPEGSIVFLDLFSGTPFNQLIMQCAGKLINGLCGVNLPMLLEALILRESMSGAELIKALESPVRASIVNVGEFMSKVISS